MKKGLHVIRALYPEIKIEEQIQQICSTCGQSFLCLGSPDEHKKDFPYPGFDLECFKCRRIYWNQWKRLSGWHI